ncbi:MAG TPA: hypothetical protein VI233_08065, partial [Puia sp.]
LRVPGPVSFDRSLYTLAWSSHPSAIYYKQEYVPQGETVEHFSKMMLIEVLQANMPLFNAVGGKVQELVDRKKSDPITEYKVTSNTDKSEFILDFVMSAGQGSNAIVEWNAYRYKEVIVNGHKTILLFANSLRAYGSAIRPFLVSLPSTRQRILKELNSYKVPSVTISAN